MHSCAHTIRRRDVLRVGATAGAFVFLGGRGRPAGASLIGTGPTATARRSRLRPDDGTFVIQTDFHNHTTFSDGVGDPETAYQMLREAGLDAAALTDHAVFGTGGQTLCSQMVQDTVFAGQNPDCSALTGINPDSWARTLEINARVDDPGAFSSIVGFEWTTNQMGHINVWYADDYISGEDSGGLFDNQALTGMIQDSGTLDELRPILEALHGTLPRTASIDGFYDWLVSNPAAANALAGWNHPNELGDFEQYKFDPRIVDKLVSVEMHNLESDYFFWGVTEGNPWPLNAALNAGYRLGILGVSDNHSDTFGRTDYNRGGLWVDELSSDGVRRGMLSRRMYSTSVVGLRLDATANDVPMGSVVGHRSGPMTFRLDLDRGPDWYGRKLFVQVVTAGADEPTLVDEVELRLPTSDEPVLEFTRDIDAADTPWVVLRIVDPEEPVDPRAVGSWSDNGGAIAYASPFYLDPDAPPPPAPQPQPRAIPTTVTLPTTGGGLVTGAAAVAGLAALLRRRSPNPPRSVQGHNHSSGAPHVPS